VLPMPKITRRRGRPPKLDKPTPFLLRLPLDLFNRVRREADANRGSMNDMIVDVLSKWSKRHPEKEN
jgi:hypothetical protein